MLSETSFERVRTIRSHLNTISKEHKVVERQAEWPLLDWDSGTRELLMGPEVAFCKRVLGMDSGNDTVNSLSAADMST